MPESTLMEDPVVRRIAAARAALPDDALSPQGVRAAAIAERVIATATNVPIEQVSAARHRTRVGGRAPAALLASATGGAALLLALGVFSGSAATGIQAAQAAMVRRVVRALTPPSGTIVIEKLRGSATHGRTITETDVSESSTGTGAQSLLFMEVTPGVANPDPFAIVNGDEEIYSWHTHTIYISSIYGPYIHSGSEHGTYVYRPTHDHGSPTAYEHQSLRLTARQAAALRSGSAAIVVAGNQVSGGQLKVVAAPRNPTRVQVIREQIAAGDLHYAGHATADGRRVIVFGSPARARPGDPASTPGTTLYLDPKTYAPIEELTGQRNPRSLATWTEYKTLPITPASGRLLSLRYFFPSARVVRNHAAYLRAAGHLTVYAG